MNSKTNLMRKPIVAGNWKMNKIASEAVNLINDIRGLLGKGKKNVDIVICPPFTALQAVSKAIAGTELVLGAQNMHWEASGAFTGEISMEMLRDLYCHYVIIGHSERRMYFHETNQTVNQKIKIALAGNLHPIVCAGETLQEREAGKTKKVLTTQINIALKDIGKRGLKSLVIAYEPIWAIGTGKTATPAQVQEAHNFIRCLLRQLSTEEIAQAMRIQYGGSVKPENADAIFAQPDVDGGLIGGASLDPESFLAIINSAISSGWQRKKI